MKKAGLDRSRRAVSLLRDLLDGKAAEVEQKHDGLLLIVQAKDGCPDILLKRARRKDESRIEPGTRRGGRFRQIAQRDADGSAAGTAQKIARRVDRDPLEVSDELAARFIRARRTIRAGGKTRPASNPRPAPRRELWRKRAQEPSRDDAARAGRRPRGRPRRRLASRNHRLLQPAARPVFLLSPSERKNGSAGSRFVEPACRHARAAILTSATRRNETRT